MRPCFASIDAVAAATEASLVTSRSTTEIGRALGAVNAASSAAVARLRPVVSLIVATTLWPRVASSFAVSSPNPLLLPVMMIVLECPLVFMESSSFR